MRKSERFVLATVMTILLMVLSSCASKPDTKKDVDFNTDMFPSFPNPLDENKELVYFLTSSGAFDKVIDREGNTEIVILEDGKNYIVCPEWYWMLIEDFYTDYLYSVKTLKLYLEGDP